MKQLLIVNDNMNFGGIQVSLCNLLCNLPKDIDVTLMLFNNNGDLKCRIPSNVKIITPNKRYRILGMTRNELRKIPAMAFLKVFYTVIACVIGKRRAMKLFGIFQKKITGYNIAISYSHPISSRVFTNGCAEFVLDKVVANKKICYVHCDFMYGGFNTSYNRQILMEYDKIACVSNSVKKNVDNRIPKANKKTTVTHNLLNKNIIMLSEDNPIEYDDTKINIIIVARLSPEKGIDRAIKAIADSQRKDINLYILGDGPQKYELKKLINDYVIGDVVYLLGKQDNPYRYMKNADYLLVPSIHEAAPVIFDEANQLGLPIITTATTSATEMVGEYGIICENNDEEIRKTLLYLEKPNIGKIIWEDKFNRIDEFCKIL